MKENKTNKQIRLIKFESSNCAGCKKLVQSLETAGRLNDVESYNIETNIGMNMAVQYGVMSVPVLIKLDNEEVVDRMIGFDIKSLTRILGDSIKNENI